MPTCWFSSLWWLIASKCRHLLLERIATHIGCTQKSSSSWIKRPIGGTQKNLFLYHGLEPRVTLNLNAIRVLAVQKYDYWGRGFFRTRRRNELAVDPQPRNRWRDCASCRALWVRFRGFKLGAFGTWFNSCRCKKSQKRCRIDDESNHRCQPLHRIRGVSARGSLGWADEVR